MNWKTSKNIVIIAQVYIILKSFDFNVTEIVCSTSFGISVSADAIAINYMEYNDLKIETVCETKIRRNYKFSNNKYKMKMKVKKCQRRNEPFSKSYLQIFCCLAYVLLTICLLESFNRQSNVDAFIANTRNATNFFEPFNIQYANSSKKVLSRNRNSRFLFDALFGIDTPPLDAADLVEDDDDEEDIPKPCKCGSILKCV